MRKHILVAAILAGIVGATAPALAAETYYSGSLEATVDTTSGGTACGSSVGDHQWVQYRMYDGALAGAFFVRGDSHTLVISASDTTDFKMDGTPGKVLGSVAFNAGGPTPGVYQQTVRGTYTMFTDATDPTMLKITKLTLSVVLNPSATNCKFIYMGVLTPMLFASPAVH